MDGMVSTEMVLVGSSAGADGWRRTHERLVELAEERAASDFEMGNLLLAALRNSVHARLGYGSLLEYAERLLGLTPKQTAERLRVARALEALPETARALRSGVVSWSAVRELTRVATTQTEKEWLDAACCKTVRELETMVSGREPGDRPGDAIVPGKKRCVLRFEVSSDTAALFHEACELVRRDAGGLDDDALLNEMARRLLGGPDDAGRASYQLAVHVCGRCGAGELESAGQLVPVGEEIIEMAMCDAQHIGRVAGAAGDVEPHVGDVDGADSSPQVGAPAVGASQMGAPARATQTIPPAVRRLVMRRDAGKCRVPGCRNHAFVDVHHLDPRSEGGQHDPERMIVLCGAHHRALHRGLLVIEGSSATGLRFHHADGTPYGGAACSRSIEQNRQAFTALRNLGFAETVAKRLLARARAVAGDGADLGTLVRHALQLA